MQARMATWETTGLLLGIANKELSKNVAALSLQLHEQARETNDIHKQFIREINARLSLLEKEIGQVLGVLSRASTRDAMQRLADTNMDTNVDTNVDLQFYR